MTDMIDGYWYASPDIMIRYAPDLDTWWLEVVDSNDKKHWDRDEKFNCYDWSNNAFIYKTILSLSYDSEEEVMSALQSFKYLLKAIKKKEYLLLSKNNSSISKETTE